MLNENSSIRVANVIARGSYNLTLMEQRLLIIIISSLQNPECNAWEDTASNKNSITLDLYEIRKLLKRDPTAGVLQYFNSLFSDLAEKHIIFTTDEGVTTDTCWFTITSIYLGDGYVTIEIPATLVPYLLNLKKCFASVKLSTVIALKSKHTLRLYLLLKSYAHKGLYACDLIKLHTVIGTADAYRKYFSRFKADILTPAIAEIHRSTELAIDVEQLKRSRKVTRLVFKISKSDRAVNEHN